MRVPQAALRPELLRPYLGRDADMSLWDLLTIGCFVMPIASSNVVARNAHLSVARHSMALLIGVVIGCCFAWAMRAVGEVIIRRTTGFSAAKREWFFRALYGSALAWCGVSLFFGGWVTSRLLLAVQ
jgi:hypothetical protein